MKQNRIREVHHDFHCCKFVDEIKLSHIEWHMDDKIWIYFTEIALPNVTKNAVHHSGINWWHVGCSTLLGLLSWHPLSSHTVISQTISTSGQSENKLKRIELQQWHKDDSQGNIPNHFIWTSYIRSQALRDIKTSIRLRRVSEYRRACTALWFDRSWRENAKLYIFPA